MANYYADRDGTKGSDRGKNKDNAKYLPPAPFVSLPALKKALFSFVGLPRLSETAANAYRRAFGSNRT